LICSKLNVNPFTGRYFHFWPSVSFSTPNKTRLKSSFVRGQKNEFHALEKCYNYFSQSTIEEIDISLSQALSTTFRPSQLHFYCIFNAQFLNFSKHPGLGLSWSWHKKTALQGCKICTYIFFTRKSFLNLNLGHYFQLMHNCFLNTFVGDILLMLGICTIIFLFSSICHFQCKMFCFMIYYPM
jgi:hypothetical protein